MSVEINYNIPKNKKAGHTDLENLAVVYTRHSSSLFLQTTVCNEIRKSYILYVYIGARKADTPINP